eukprot:1139419-Pelagomonas_calceolata.AAC.13
MFGAAGDHQLVITRLQSAIFVRTGGWLSWLQLLKQSGPSKARWSRAQHSLPLEARHGGYRPLCTGQPI